MQVGLPDGAIRSTLSQSLPNPSVMRQTIGELVAGRLDPTETDVLAAWLSAFKHHWPSAFAESLGEVGDASLQKLLPKVAHDRYLKLRRIAIANLANLL